MSLTAVCMKSLVCELLLVGDLSVSVVAWASIPLLLQKPNLSKTHIAFSYSGDLWLVPREGGEARLLTSGSGFKTDPVFSRDGSKIAFTGDYDFNVDVYVIPSTGGVPPRLTHHPAVDKVIGLATDL